MYTIFIPMIFKQLSSLRREGRRQLTSTKHPLHSGHGVLFCLFILFLATLGLGVVCRFSLVAENQNLAAEHGLLIAVASLVGEHGL